MLVWIEVYSKQGQLPDISLYYTRLGNYLIPPVKYNSIQNIFPASLLSVIHYTKSYRYILKYSNLIKKRQMMVKPIRLNFGVSPQR